MSVRMEQLVQSLERLTGEPVPYPERLTLVANAPSADGKIGFSQLNELLLLAGLDRIARPFFAYLLSGAPEHDGEMAFESLDQLDGRITEFRKTALLIYGNVKFAFKSWSSDPALLRDVLEASAPISACEFEQRHDPIFPVRRIEPADAFLTGYLIEGEIARRLKDDPGDVEAQALDQVRRDIVESALQNQTAYYASDHLDVYVATSMRARHEFISVSRIVNAIFQCDSVGPLKLRWFDPTQAYCTNRIDKGLAEALMLKRAKCTIYLAQESDTLGKDSELASTLAQGKPVIAFVPEVSDKYLDFHFTALRDAEPDKTERAHLMDQLRLFDPDSAWNDAEVQEWCRRPGDVPVERLRARVSTKIKAHYDRRARTLLEIHPLGIQVNLDTGVANGVLVVRNFEDCAELVRRIVTRSLQFELVEEPDKTVLKECISGSIFRVMTKDAMLTNTFWNFYLNPAE